MGQNTFYGGTSGMVFPVPNKTMYPPQFRDKSRLTYYASLFNSLEVNSSFYKVPMAKTVKKWADEVPDDFKFTFKLWRDISHNKELAFKIEDVTRFMQVISNAGDKKGCLLVQFPPSVRSNNIIQLDNLLSGIINADPIREWRISVEFRHASWYNENTYDLLIKHGTNMVLHDMPASIPPMLALAGDVVYLRFHGPDGKYRGAYADDFLSEYATYIKEWQQEGKTVYAYFNNTMGDALNNLVTLNSMVNQAIYF